MNTQNSDTPSSPVIAVNNSDAMPQAPSESAPRDHTQTQISLQQASAALESAYRRIRQFRRSLLEVADSVSSPETQGRPSETTYPTPDLNSIALAAQDLSTIDFHREVNSLIHNTTSGQRPSDATRYFNSQISTTSSSARDSASDSGSPLIPSALYPRPNRSHNNSRFLRHREYQADDASTSLGRRVAAREATGTLGTNSEMRPTSYSLSRYEGNSAQLLATIEREFEQTRIARQQRLEAPTDGILDASVTPLLRRAAEFRRQLVAQNREASIISNSERRRHRSSVVLPLRLASEQGAASTYQDSPLPDPFAAFRSPVFDEESSSVQDHISAAGNASRPSDSGEEYDRSYVIRRRFNPDGEEHVHPINLEWLGDSPTWVYRPSQRGQPEAVSNGTQRRRGWARLDADGNEIPSDEEEELERIRSEYRLQAQSRPSPTRVTDLGYHSLRAPTTSASLSPDEDDESASFNARTPRVRLSALASRDYPGSVIDSVLKVDSMHVGRQTHGSVGPPFRSNPLPMPIEDMAWSPPRRKHPQVNGVSKHASFAGR